LLKDHLEVKIGQVVVICFLFNFSELDLAEAATVQTASMLSKQLEDHHHLLHLPRSAHLDTCDLKSQWLDHQMESASIAV